MEQASFSINTTVLNTYHCKRPRSSPPPRWCCRGSLRPRGRGWCWNTPCSCFCCSPRHRSSSRSSHSNLHLLTPWACIPSHYSSCEHIIILTSQSQTLNWNTGRFHRKYICILHRSLLNHPSTVGCMMSPLTECQGHLHNSTWTYILGRQI